MKKKKQITMGCGSSGHVVAPAESANGNGKMSVGNGRDANSTNGHNNDDLPTVVLPETPAKPKPREYLCHILSNWAP